VITISERAVPLAVAQRIFVKFLTNENVKPADILIRLTEHISVTKLSQGPRSMTGVSRLKTAEQRLKYSKIAPSAGNVKVSVFWDSHDVLFIDFLIEQRISKAAYYLKLLKDQNLFLGVKQPEREADNSPPSSAEAKNTWSYTSTPLYAFTAWCSASLSF
jgi:hypothetical protein